jgi:IS5 family transposase
VLRNGIPALEKPDNLRRLDELDDAQLRTCVGQLLKRTVAPSWTQDEVGVLFAHLKRIFRLGRLRLRGPCGAQFEFTMAAIAQNLRRLAKLLIRPPPVTEACFA